MDQAQRERLSIAQTARWQRPGEREAASERSKAAGRNPELRKKRSVSATAQWSDEERRRERSEAYKARFADPEFKAAVLAKRLATREARKRARRGEPLGNE